MSLAALHVISLPSRLVESAIAASVVLAALNNLKPLVQSRRWVVAFGFGLIHGFGFASVLADLGLPGDALVLALVGFNLGVELGQLAIVALFLPLAYSLRRSRFYRRTVMVGGSLLIARVAAVWFVERAFDLSFSCCPSNLERQRDEAALPQVGLAFADAQVGAAQHPAPGQRGGEAHAAFGVGLAPDAERAVIAAQFDGKVRQRFTIAQHAKLHRLAAPRRALRRLEQHVQSPCSPARAAPAPAIQLDARVFGVALLPLDAARAHPRPGVAHFSGWPGSP